MNQVEKILDQIMREREESEGRNKASKGVC